MRRSTTSPDGAGWSAGDAGPTVIGAGERSAGEARAAAAGRVYAAGEELSSLRRGFRIGVQLARQGAELGGGVGDEPAVGIAALNGVEGANGFGDIGGEGVDADLELDQIGGRAARSGGGTSAIAQRLNGGANADGVGRGERELLAIDVDGFAVDMGGDLAVGAGGDAGDFGEAEVGIAELGVLAADAGVILAELVPGEAEVVEHFGIADLAEALGAGGRATAGNDGEGLLEPDPGAEVDSFFRIHTPIWETIVAEFGQGMFQGKGLACGFRFERRGVERSLLRAPERG